MAKLERQAAKLRKLFEQEVLEAKRSGATVDDVWAVKDRERFEVCSVLDEIVYEKDRFWRNQANRHAIELHSESEEGMRQKLSTFGEMQLLTDRAIVRIRAAIKKDRREQLGVYAPYVIGVIGALTGLVSVIFR